MGRVTHWCFGLLSMRRNSRCFLQVGEAQGAKIPQDEVKPVSLALRPVSVDQSLVRESNVRGVFPRASCARLVRTPM